MHKKVDSENHNFSPTLYRGAKCNVTIRAIEMMHCIYVRNTRGEQPPDR